MSKKAEESCYLCKECIEPILTSIYEDTVKEMKNGSFLPVAIPMVWNDKEMKVGCRCRCRLENAMGVVLVMTGSSRKARNNEEWEYMLQNQETERPSLYPKSLRQENLIITFMNLYEPVNSWTLLASYVGDGDKIKFGKKMITDEMASGILEMVWDECHV